MYKKLLALSLALVLCVSPVFAVSDADNSYYSFEPVSYGSLGERAISTLAASAGWSQTDHDYLNQIRLALTSKNTGTLLSYIISIKDSVSNSYDKLFYIKQNTDYLQNINNNSNSVVSLLRSDLKGSDILNLLNSAHLDNLVKDSTVRDALLFPDGYSRIANINDVFTWLSNHMSFWLGRDTIDSEVSSTPTLYHYVKNLSETLASDDDKALSDSQKPNRDQIKQDFVSGSSGKTSLGASDFGDLSSIGGCVKDSISLNGQSSISVFTGGLSDADDAGQGWFSANTRDALDSVSSSSSYGLKREKGNSDIYNMAGFSEHYSWLYGG
ncbi:hypothetical protein [Inovirus sp.]|nr:hypothetical protein [Inovirus sp.]